MVMTLHRLSAGAGYQYLLRHTATGDWDDRGRGGHGKPVRRWQGPGVGFAAGAHRRVTVAAVGRFGPVAF
jgi:hypothetical protein